jgi:signal transduction histidine kinase
VGVVPGPGIERKLSELLATAIDDREVRAALQQLAEEQAALRRVATLVARETAPEALFAAVVREVAGVLGVDAAHIGRYDSDGTVVSAAQWGYPTIPIGARFPLDGDSVSARVLRTGRPARMDRYEDASGAIADTIRQIGIRFAVGAPIYVDGRPWGVMTVTSQGNPFPDEAESRLQSFTDLVATAIANAATRAELKASRARIVAASDEARHRIERDLHDGVQQQLIALSLQLAEMAAELPVGDALKQRLDTVAAKARASNDALVEIARGIHPTILRHGGLALDLKSQARRALMPVDVDANIEGSLPSTVEIAAHYVVSEALTNVAKHAHASHVHLGVTTDDETLTLRVRDDGVGGATIGDGSGLVGLQDRVEALGGTITLDSIPGCGTTLVVELPTTELASEHA